MAWKQVAAIALSSLVQARNCCLIENGKPSRPHERPLNRRSESENNMSTTRPESAEYAEFFAGYIALVPAGDLMETLENQLAEMHEVFGGLTSEHSEVLHPPYTWSLKQVLGHLIDGERVFGYRIHRFATGDGVSVPGFDENLWVSSMSFSGVSADVLLDEWMALRQGNMALLQRLRADQWLRRGEAGGKPISVRALAFILAGHILHHLRIVRLRLGPK
jgi:hypothetical protein